MKFTQGIKNICGITNRLVRDYYDLAGSVVCAGAFMDYHNLIFNDARPFLMLGGGLVGMSGSIAEAQEPYYRDLRNALGALGALAATSAIGVNATETSQALDFTAAISVSYATVLTDILRRKRDNR